MTEQDSLSALFAKYDLDPELRPRCCCPEPWMPIVDQLISDLIADGWDKNLVQLKEKFGSFRFYVGGRTQNQQRLIDEAAVACQKLCIDCGDDDGLEDAGWGMIKCATCKST